MVRDSVLLALSSTNSVVSPSLLTLPSVEVDLKALTFVKKSLALFLYCLIADVF